MPVVQPTHGNGEPQVQLGDQLLDAAIGAEGGLVPPCAPSGE